MRSTAKWIAFVVGTAIVVVGFAGLLMPDVLLWISQRFDTAAAWFTLAAVRTIVGVLLITAAPRSRFPRGLRVLGAVVLVLAVVTLLAGAAGVAQSRAAIDGWLAMGMTVVRLTALPVIALGGFIAYACGPKQAG